MSLEAYQKKEFALFVEGFMKQEKEAKTGSEEAWSSVEEMKGMASFEKAVIEEFFGGHGDKAKVKVVLEELTVGGYLMCKMMIEDDLVFADKKCETDRTLAKTWVALKPMAAVIEGSESLTYRDRQEYRLGQMQFLNHHVLQFFLPRSRRDVTQNVELKKDSLLMLARYRNNMNCEYTSNHRHTRL